MKTCTQSIARNNFVSPNLCQDLENLLMPKGRSFFWKINNAKQVELCSNFFDDDGYYQDAISVLSELEFIRVLSAYTIADLEIVLPDFSIKKVGERYRVECDKKFSLYPQVHTRLVDALAMMVIQGLRKNVIQISNL